MRYIHQDHLGSTSVITDESGDAVYEAAYDPWGNVRVSTGTADIDRLYTGQRFDSVTGLYYYNARYYDPELARFISPDTIVPGVGDPQAWNRYAYVLGNPLRYTDPSGHCIMMDDENGNILQTNNDWFDCTFDELAGQSWSTQQFWAALARSDPDWQGHWNRNALIGRLLENEYFGLLALAGVDNYGRPMGNIPSYCWVPNAQTYKCQQPQAGPPTVGPAPGPGNPSDTGSGAGGGNPVECLLVPCGFGILEVAPTIASLGLATTAMCGAIPNTAATMAVTGNAFFWAIGVGANVVTCGILIGATGVTTYYLTEAATGN